MNIAESLRPIKDFDARRGVVDAQLDEQVKQMPNIGIDREIRIAWLVNGEITARTKGAIRLGISHVLAARTREELFAQLPSELFLDPHATRRGKHMEEVTANHNLQQKLNSHKSPDASISDEERAKIASLIARLSLTSSGQEANSTGSLRERLRFIGIATSTITRFIIDTHELPITANEEPSPARPPQTSEEERNILDRIDEALGDR